MCFSAKRPARLWGPPCLLFNLYGVNRWGFGAHFHPVARLR
jgi:hypothetical protein